MKNSGAPIHAKLNEIRKRYRDGFLGRSKREQIDAEFAGMATDEKYQTVCKELNSESANREPQAGPSEKITFDHNVNGHATYAWFENKYYTLEHDDCVRKLVAAVVERELQELRAKPTTCCGDAHAELAAMQSHFEALGLKLVKEGNTILYKNEAAASLRGLVGRICETVSEIGWCSICGRTDCVKNPLVHKPDCIISEAEAAIKEPHNG